METNMSVQSAPSLATVSRLAKASFAAVLLAGVGVGAAEAANKVGWVWADQPSATSYTPNPSYSFNSSGGAVGISRSSTGVYNVSFAGLGSSLVSNVLVSGYSTSGACKVSGWNFSSASIGVLCFDPSGAPVDSYFTLVYQARAGGFGSSSKGLAFLWANDASSASYTPSTSYQYNSTGGVNTMTRSGPGIYTAILPGLTTAGGTVQVTAYGSGAGRCKVSGWSPGVDGQHVGVLCFDASGAASDQQFTMVFAQKVPVAYLGTEVTGIYGWYHKSKGQPGYKLSKTYRFNNLTSGALTGSRSGKGNTTVNYSGSASYSTSNQMVTAYGSDNSYCNVDGWAPPSTNCYGQGGHPKDSRYDVSFNVTTP
jgi:hypothetical protein